MDTAETNALAQQLDAAVKWLDYARARHLLGQLTRALTAFREDIDAAGSAAYPERLVFYMDGNAALTDTLRHCRQALDDAVTHCPDTRIRLLCSAGLLTLVQLDNRWQQFVQEVRQPPDIAPGG